jgi:membrane protein
MRIPDSSRAGNTVPTLPKQYSWWYSFRILVALWWETFQNRGIVQAAAALAFSSVLAIVPLAAIAFSIFALKPQWFSTMQETLQSTLLQRLMPNVVADMVLQNVNTFAQRSRKMTWIGFCFLFVTATAMLWTIEKAIAKIWEKKRRRGIARRTFLYWIFILSVPFMLSAILWASVSVLNKISHHWSNAIEKGNAWQADIIPMVVGFSFLVMMLKTLPPARIRTKDAVLGAMLSCVLIELLKRVFTWIFFEFPTYRTIYGPVVALPFFLLWLQAVWLSVLLGAVLTSCLPTWRDVIADKNQWRGRFRVKKIRY